MNEIEILQLAKDVAAYPNFGQFAEFIFMGRTQTRHCIMASSLAEARTACPRATLDIEGMKEKAEWNRAWFNCRVECAKHPELVELARRWEERKNRKNNGKIRAAFYASASALGVDVECADKLQAYMLPGLLKAIYNINQIRSCHNDSSSSAATKNLLPDKGELVK